MAPKPLVIAERFRFHKRDQREGESINEYAAELQRLSEHCDFGTGLNDALRDRLVGIRDEGVQKRLLTKENLTFDKALKMAEAAEQAGKDAAQFHDTSRLEKPLEDVHVVQSGGLSCSGCGGRHLRSKCRFKDVQCRFCKKEGHIERVCRSKPYQGVDNQNDPLQTRQSTKTLKKKKLHAMEETLSEEDYQLNWGRLRNIQIHSLGTVKPFYKTVVVEGQKMKMELDTGAAVSLISYNNYLEKLSHLPLRKAVTQLKTYTGEVIMPKGQVAVKVQGKNGTQTLPLLVVEGSGPPLLGRNWLSKLEVLWNGEQINAVFTQPQETEKWLNDLQIKYPSVFKDVLGTLKGMKAKVNLKEGAIPVFCQSHSVPFAMKAKVEEEIERLENQGIITPTNWSEWATPVVAIPKADGTVRLCGDYKVTVNPAIKVDKYPLPTTEEIFASLSGGVIFSKLDLRQAYLQMEVDDNTQKILTIHTHKGLYLFKRLAFGVASAPAIWQRTMEQILQGIPMTRCLLDDIVVTGKSLDDHCTNLDKVLERLAEYGLTLNRKKCAFFKDSIQFCGHRLDREGIHKTQDKIEAVTRTPSPQNVSQLRSFLGLINYYNRFLPNLSTQLAPLYHLLKKGQKWCWSRHCQQSFEAVKELVSSDQMLVFYNPKLPIKLSCDASPYGLGAVLSHVLEDGQERPVAFASRSLSRAEENYSQIDKETLALVWGIKHFHQYLWGVKFTLETDHKPLVSIFSPSKIISATAAARLQRYATFLTRYTYDIKYRKTEQHGNADALSRLPLPTTVEKPLQDAVAIFQLSQIERLPVQVSQIRKETQRDPILSRVLQYILQGWPQVVEDAFNAYFIKQHELTVEQGCILWEIRTVIPPSLRQLVISELHSGHIGVVKMKALARSYFWWPGLDKDIESSVKSCNSCERNKRDPKLAPLHSWECATKPWERMLVL